MLFPRVEEACGGQVTSDLPGFGAAGSERSPALLGYRNAGCVIILGFLGPAFIFQISRVKKKNLNHARNNMFFE